MTPGDQITDDARSARSPQFIPVSALFLEVDSVGRAMSALMAAGVPRDLVEVVVSPAGARRFFPNARRASQREVFRFAAYGGLVGLGCGVTLSLVIVSLPEFVAPSRMALVQLLGPNALTVAGAALGAVVGSLRRRQPVAHHARSADAADSIVVVVRARGSEQVPTLLALLAEAGGEAPRVEPN